MQTRCLHCTRGFTLIELLVVVVIIGIMVSFATLSLGNNEARQAQETADRLQALVELAKEEALFNSENIGILFWHDGYAFYHMENQQWAPMTDDMEFRPRTLPEGLSLALYLEGLKAELPGRLGQRKRPQVFILSSGEVTPFEVEIGAGATTVRLRADALGNLASDSQGL